MSVAEVADKIGRSERTVQRWEVGHHHPSLCDAIAWADALRVDLWPRLPGDLWNGGEVDA